MVQFTYDNDDNCVFEGYQLTKEPNPRNTSTHSRTCGREGLYLLFSQEKNDISILPVTKQYEK